MSRARWFGGLILMAAIAVAVYVLLVEVGVAKWLATVGAILAAASAEPTSHLRRGWTRARRG